MQADNCAALKTFRLQTPPSVLKFSKVLVEKSIPEMSAMGMAEKCCLKVVANALKKGSRQNNLLADA